jgi:hypothetical protein
MGGHGRDDNARAGDRSQLTGHSQG